RNSYFGGIKTTDIDKITELSNILFDKQELKGAELIKDKLVIYKNENDDLYTLKKITNMGNFVAKEQGIIRNGTNGFDYYFYNMDSKITGNFNGFLNKYFKVDGNIIVDAGNRVSIYINF